MEAEKARQHHQTVTATPPSMFVTESEHHEDEDSAAEGSSELVLDSDLKGVGSELDRVSQAEKNKRIQEQLKVRNCLALLSR